MIKRILTFCLGILLVCGAVQAQSMSDQQIATYVQKGVAAGKSQQTLAMELMSKGVSREQLQRVYQQYQNGGAAGGAGNNRTQAAQGRNKQQPNNYQTKQSSQQSYRNNESNNSRNGKQNGYNRPNQNSRSGQSRVGGRNQNQLQGGNANYQEYDDMMMPFDEMGDSLSLFDEPIYVSTETPDSMKVFGRDIFMDKNLDFAPNESMATPRNYLLGPGDEVVIDIYGTNQQKLTEEISPEGSINIEVLGPVYLNGKTVEEANNYLKKQLSKIYAGLGQDANTTEIRLSVGKLRTIQVNVLGDVNYPGTYQLSSVATAFHALYAAGGIKDPGTLRNIKVNRNGRQIATVDVYDFLIHGNKKGDVHLQDGDVIVVPAYENMITLRGKVKRPMLFEMKKGENLMQLLTYAGGFAKEAYREHITIVRQNGKDYEVHTVEDANFSKFAMVDGDSVTVGKLLSRYHNRLSVKGAVYRAGDYQLSGKVNTIKALVEMAGGLLPEAFTNRAVLHRENDDCSIAAQSVDLKGILAGTTPDIILKNNDELFIPSIYDMKDMGELTIRGEVAFPGTYPFAENTTLEDLIIQAGGLNQSASLARVDVSRRITDNKAQTAHDKMAELMSFSIKDGFVIEGEPGFVLQPYDEVYVRKSPSYVPQRNVSVIGEANFTGEFPLTTRDERLTSLLQKCGGLTEYAYVDGARLIRQLTEDERTYLDQVMESMQSSGMDTLNVSRMKNQMTDYYVAIDLKKAMAKPGGDDDVVLREGDILDIPVYQNTVRILGAVTSQNVTTYVPGKNYKYYINEAGGFNDMARKRHAYVMYMNGHISQLKSNTPITPGSQIVVPKRTTPKPTVANVVSSLGSMASVATSLATLFIALKK